MGNTVGSLNQFQRSILIGTLLGDGYLRRLKGRADAFLEVNHSISQRNYVDWKYNQLKPFVKSLPRSYSGNGKRIGYRFATKQHPELTQMKEDFYDRQGYKIVPKNLVVNSLALAVWFMDDGSKCRDSDVYLNTQQFDSESQERLMHILRKQFSLEARLNKDKHYMRLRFLKADVHRLMEIIDGHVVPSMRYKLVKPRRD